MKRKFVLSSIISICALAALLFTACSMDSDEPKKEPAQENPTPQPTRYTVSFSVGTGTGTPPQSQSLSPGTVITLPEQGALIAPAYHTFDGWETGGLAYAAKASFTVTANTQFVAQWKSAVDPNKTYIEFNNLERYPVTMYSDPSRQAELALVPAEGKKLIESEPNLQGVALYPQFLLTIEGVPIIYDGPALTARVDAKKVNRVDIPVLESVETGSAYIKIENTGSYSLTFNKGNSELAPLGAASSIIASGETAAYRIEPGTAAIYSFMRNTSVPVSFPAELTEFNADTLYAFRYDGKVLTLNAAKSITLHLPAPGKPIATAGNGSIAVTWTAVERADSYNVYCGTSETPPASPVQTGITGTSTTISELTYGALYYVWVQAVNARGTSSLSEAASCNLLMIWTVNSSATFTEAIAAINASSQAANYTIALTEDIAASAITFTVNAVKTITIRGDSSLRSIANSGNAMLFTVPAGITLVLEHNVWLNGNTKEYSAVYVNGGAFEMTGGKISGAKDSAVKVSGNGTFTMKGGEISGNTVSDPSRGTPSYGGGVYVDGALFTMEGGKISGNTVNGSASSYAGGVYVSGGTFTMKGGEISGNTASASSRAAYGGGVYVESATFTMSGGKISGNTASATNSRGGGVYVDSATFTMSGGEISGNTASTYGGGVHVASGTFTKSGGGTIDAANNASTGKVAYVSSGRKQRTTAAGPGVNLDSATSGSAGGWE